MTLEIDELSAGVNIATLGSIAILTATFLEKADFVVKYGGKLQLPNPASFFISAGIFLLLSSGAFLAYNYFGKEDNLLLWL